MLLSVHHVRVAIKICNVFIILNQDVYFIYSYILLHK